MCLNSLQGASSNESCFATCVYGNSIENVDAIYNIAMAGIGVTTVSFIAMLPLLSDRVTRLLTREPYLRAKLLSWIAVTLLASATPALIMGVYMYKNPSPGPYYNNILGTISQHCSLFCGIRDCWIVGKAGPPCFFPGECSPSACYVVENLSFIDNFKRSFAGINFARFLPSLVLFTTGVVFPTTCLIIAKNRFTSRPAEEVEEVRKSPQVDEEIEEHSLIIQQAKGENEGLLRPTRYIDHYSSQKKTDFNIKRVILAVALAILTASVMVVFWNESRLHTQPQYNPYLASWKIMQACKNNCSIMFPLLCKNDTW